MDQIDSGLVQGMALVWHLFGPGLESDWHWIGMGLVRKVGYGELEEVMAEFKIAN